MSNPICPYCLKVSKLESSSIVYGGNDYGPIFICVDYPECDAYVGIHKGTTKPLGRLANKELREYKKLAHSFFDPIWQKYVNKYKNLSKKSIRAKAYKWLAANLNIGIAECHIGMFDIDMCKKVIDICKKRGVDK